MHTDNSLTLTAEPADFQAIPHVLHVEFVNAEPMAVKLSILGDFNAAGQTPQPRQLTSNGRWIRRELATGNHCHGCFDERQAKPGANPPGRSPRGLRRNRQGGNVNQFEFTTI